MMLQRLRFQGEGGGEELKHPSFLSPCDPRSRANANADRSQPDTVGNLRSA